MPIKINIEKAKEIHIERWREARKPLLDNLDIESLRFAENNPNGTVQGSDRAEEILLIRKKKQELRDVTDVNLSSITEVEELKKIWPDCLGQKTDY